MTRSTTHACRRSRMADPYPAFRRLRETAPVSWSTVLRGWVLTGYRDVRAALFDPRLSADRITPFMASLSTEKRAALSGLERMLTRWAVFVDPPDHTRLRRQLRSSPLSAARFSVDRLAMKGVMRSADRRGSNKAPRTSR